MNQRDAKEAIVALHAIPLGAMLLALAVTVGGIAYYMGTHHEKQSVALAAKVDTVRITQQARAIAAETVKVRLAAKLRTDTLVQVLTDTQLVVRASPSAPAETVFVLPEVGDRIRKCDAFASSCQVQLARDSAVIRSQASLIAAMKPSLCGRRCGFVLGLVAGVAVVRVVR